VVVVYFFWFLNLSELVLAQVTIRLLLLGLEAGGIMNWFLLDQNSHYIL